MTWKPDVRPGSAPLLTPTGGHLAPGPQTPGAGDRAGQARADGHLGGGAAAPEPASVLRWSPTLGRAAPGAGDGTPPTAPGTPALETLASLVWPSAGLGGSARQQAVQWLQAAWPGAAWAPPPSALLAVQVWSPGFLAQWLEGRPAPPGWWPAPARQLPVQTPSGPQALHLQLWLPALASPAGEGARPGAPAAQAPAVPPAPVRGSPFSPVVQTALVQAGALAWVLADEAQAPRCALLVLEWVPRREPSVYSPGLPIRHDDPWRLQAQWWALGAREQQAALDSAPHCHRAGCPYKGRAACPQPFCPTTGAVPGVGAVEGL